MGAICVRLSDRVFETGGRMSSRETILKSIRSHLAASPPDDPSESVSSVIPISVADEPVALFKQSLEAVNGHCVVVESEEEIVQQVTRISGKIAISDAPGLNRLFGVQPTGNIFDYDVGISTAQAA